MTGMGTSQEYAFIAVALSLASLLLSLLYLKRIIHSYRVHHDERAAVSLGKAIGLLVISIGLVVSSLGLPMDRPELSLMGLTLARGALLTLMATLILANVRPDGDEV